PPFRFCEFDIMYNEGISLSGDLLDTAVVFKVINKNGNSYSYGETKLGVGRETAKRFLKDSPKLMEEIREKVMESSQATAENTTATE
ncbi:DNA recombination/repair protein RecA, partial [Patescibacteria group bacterium]|nr:DNA recombination/repair protein RecA [Patescibacteria group bacterium]